MYKFVIIFIDLFTDFVFTFFIVIWTLNIFERLCLMSSVLIN